MTPEEFIVAQVINGLKGTEEAISSIADETISDYRKGKFDCIQSFIQRMRGKLCLINGATVKDYMEFSGMSESKARKYLLSLEEAGAILVNRDNRPHVYKI